MLQAVYNYIQAGDSFEGGIETSFTLYRNRESYESNYNYLDYYLFESIG